MPDSNQPQSTITHLRIAEDARSIRHVFVRDLTIDARIGVHAHEKDGPQRIRVNVDLSVVEAEGRPDDHLSDVVCYEEVTKGIKEIIAIGHINLVETLAEKIAQVCLGDSRVAIARVRVEKLDAIPEAASVGVEIERIRPAG